jgi:Sec-independent protein translocase protein TatA
MFLDPQKLLLIFIVGIVVLGPDKLPQVARQIGAAWNELRKFREKLETEVRDTFPDLPSTHHVAQAVRSPLAFLDQLADAHEKDQKDADAQANAPTFTPTPPGGSKPETALEPAVADYSTNGTERPQREALPAETSEPEAAPVRPHPRRVGSTRPWRGSMSSELSTIPDDPSMN